MSEKVISRYQLKEEIGRGGMGKVYRAFDHELQRHVALKLIASRDAEKPNLMARFKREAQAASSLSHPNICTIHDFGEHEGAPFYVMELVPGRSLDKILQERTLSWREAVNIGLQIAEGLEAAHSQGIVHRDIKPANLILTPEGTVKILDFGIAKLSEADETLGDKTSLTQTGNLLGTLRYCSPEQALGKPVDQRSDLFSLGVVLYEMLSGAHPFGGNTGASQINSLLNLEPHPLHTQEPGIPAALDRLLQRLLAKDPARRPATAREVEDFLRSLTAPPTLRRRYWIWSLAPLLATVLVLVVLVLFWYSAWYPGQPGASAPSQRNLALLPLLYQGPEQERSNATMFPALLAEAFRSGSELEVAPFDTSRQYEPSADPDKTRKELRVTWLLTGAMTVTEPLYTMRLELTRDRSQPGWSQEYRGEVSDLFSMAGQVSKDVAAALGEDSLSNSGLLGQDREAVRLYLEGMRFLEGWDVESNAERARDSFSEAIQIDPDFGEALAGLARALWRSWEESGDPEWATQAEMAAHQAVKDSPANPSSHLALGIVQLGEGRFEQAVDSFERAQGLAPADDAVCRNIADAYARLGRASEAETMYRKAISLQPSLWQNYRALGNFLLSQGRFEEAKEPYREIIRLRPQSDIGHNNLALVQLSLGEFAEAEVHLLAAIAIQPTMAGYTNLGFVYYSTGRYQEAAQQFIQATRFSPDESPWLSLGDAYRQLNQRENAEKAYRQAISISRSKLTVDANDPELRSRLGYSLAGVGDCKGAFNELEAALQSGSKSPWIAYYSAVSHALCGEDDLATEALLRAVEGGLTADVKTNPDLRHLLARPAVKQALEGDR